MVDGYDRRPSTSRTGFESQVELPPAGSGLGGQPVNKTGVDRTNEVRLLGPVPCRCGVRESISGFEPGDGGSTPPDGAHSGEAQAAGRLPVEEGVGGSNPPTGAVGL